MVDATLEVVLEDGGVVVVTLVDPGCVLVVSVVAALLAPRHWKYQLLIVLQASSEEHEVGPFQPIPPPV